jgi:hypothetical protein
VKPYAAYVKHLIFPNLQEWFEIMKENYEEPIVECEGCNKKFSNNKNASIIVGEKRYYACSGPCKSKVGEIMRRRERNEERKEKLIDMINSRA